MTLRRARAVRTAHACLLVCSVLTLAACSTSPTQPAQPAQHAKTAPASITKTAKTRPAPVSVGSCPPQKPRYAWAVDLTANGRMAWKASLPTTALASSSPLEPLTVGAVALFAQDATVHGLDLANGHQLWSWAGGQSVFGMWPDGGLVAVLTDQITDHARLTGLDAATGAVRWSLRLPRGLYGNQALTADGGLAMFVAGGILQVVNLADGRIRWQRRTSGLTSLAAADGIVIYGGNGGLTGYDDRTGQPRWTITSGLALGTYAELIGGLVLLSSPLNTLTAVIPATGRIAWRFHAGSAPTVLSAGPAGLAVAVYDRSSRLYLLDLRTGQVRWHADATLAFDTIPLVTSTAVISAEGLDGETIVDRDAANGRVQWQDALPQQPTGSQQVVQAGPLVMVQGNPSGSQTHALLSAYELASGRLAWRAYMPASAPLPPVPAPDGILVQSADPPWACPLSGWNASATEGVT